MKPRILILTPTIGRRGGGVSEAARLFTEALKTDGRFAPEVVTLRDADFETDRTAWPDVPIHAFRAYGPSNYGFSPGMLRYVLINRSQAVHVHGIWMFHVFCAALWSWIYRRPALVTPHGMLEPWIRQRSPRLKEIVSRLYQNRFLRRATLHVLTEKERDDVAKARLPICRCHIIPNYVSPPPSDLERPTWWQPEFATRRVYLFFGRIHDKKGWRELCSAWKCLNTDNPSWPEQAQLVFCGWPDDCPEFEPTVHALNERFGNALFAGAQFGTDRDRSYASADVFVLPSKSEGLPMSILEAWAAGVPTVMTRACNLDLGFEKGAAVETGESSEAISKTLSEVQHWSDEQMVSAQTAARGLIEAEFSEGEVKIQMTSMLSSLINKAVGEIVDCD